MYGTKAAELIEEFREKCFEAGFNVMVAFVVKEYEDQTTEVFGTDAGQNTTVSRSALLLQVINSLTNPDTELEQRESEQGATLQ